MRKTLINILYLLFSIGVFSALFFLFSFSFILATLSAVILFFLFSGFIGTGKYPDQREEKIPFNVGTAIEIGFEKLHALDKKCHEIQDEEIRQKLGRIYGLGRKILDDVHENPTDYHAARQFFNYYLDATNSILDKYITLQKNSEHLSIADESFRKTEELLDTVEIAYQKQLEKLYEDDVMDLDTELKVLAKTIKSEGF
ncbi:MAG: 5-bromo-4-chloroindolyl phosphate hydrolysis family protein [Bacteroidota bacterium]